MTKKAQEISSITNNELSALEDILLNPNAYSLAQLHSFLKNVVVTFCQEFSAQFIRFLTDI